MRELKIATANSAQAKTWKNKTITWEEFCHRLQTPIRTSETVDEYKKMKKPDRDAAKDKGGFVGGQLKDNRRKIESVISRSMLTLDIDKASLTFIEDYVSKAKYVSFLYTTHSHTPDAPRCRVIIPLSRDVTPSEYMALARYYASEWGIDMFDECSYKTNQLMYWPTTPSNGEFIYKEVKGDWLDPDAYLAKHPYWENCSLLPTSSRESVVKETSKKKQEDPLTKSGIVGAFCRTYTVTQAISTFLSDVYKESTVEGRYDYIKGESFAGVVVYDDKFAYSHHATDPASNKLLNAFDLVRIHKFGDDTDSFKLMADFATKDPKVNTTLLSEKMKSAEDEFATPDDEDWKENLTHDKNGNLVNSLHNIRLIMENDDFMKNIVFNQLADGMEIKGEVPWKHPAKFWRDADDAQLICYVDSHYGTFSERNYDIAVTKAADDRSYHPIREYFETLPEWDKVIRADTAIIDYLGAEDNEYVRAVTRKILCAAYRRVYEPGIKFDTMLVLNGAQGIGKSTFISNLGKEWFSDSLTLSDMNDKTAAEKLQGYWILEIGELAGMKKADLDKVKAFVSRQDDKYRASFGRRVTPHPRQCVFFGTTNSENGYLRDITGNRRFWNVKVVGNSKYRPWDMDKETIDQIWAEVKILASSEPLFLPPHLEDFAKNEQRAAMEQDDREGLVVEYLNMLLPDSWDDMDTTSRRGYIRDTDDPTRPKGVNKRTEVSNIEIWCECFGKPREDMKPSDSYAISAIMARLTDWEKPETRKRLPIYGQQRIYVKKK